MRRAAAGKEEVAAWCGASRLAGHQGAPWAEVGLGGTGMFHSPLQLSMSTDFWGRKVQEGAEGTGNLRVQIQALLPSRTEP